MKTFRFLFLALALMLSINASAHDFEVDGIYYYIISSSDLKVEVTYRGSSYDSYSDEYSGSVVIPEKVKYNYKEYSVTSIGWYAFRNCSGLTSVTIPNSVTSIGDRAFEGCSALTSVTIPNSVTSIGYMAFVGCDGLTAVHITDLSAWCKIKYDGWSPNPTYYAHHLYLNGEEITNLVIPDDVTSIGNSAFSGCSGLTSVTIPNSVTSIGGGAFSGCSGLTSVTIPNSVTSIGSGAFSGCSSLTAVHITDLSAWCKIDFEYFEYYKFPFSDAYHLYLNGEEITNLVIPDDVTRINRAAFSHCYLTSVTIPNSIKSIGIHAFSGCSSLTNIRIEDGDESIYMVYDHGEGVFNRCPIETLYIGRNLSTLEFSGKSTLSTIIIGNSVTRIDLGVFKDCTGLTNFRIEDGDSNITISNTTFSQCPLDTLYLGRNISVSTNSSPFSCITTSYTVTIGNSVTKIGDYIFSGCTSLKSVNIPNSVTSIGDNAFYGCSGLTAVYITDLAAWCKIKFNDFDSNPTSCTHNLYLNGKEIKDLVIPDGTTSIGDYAFYSCSELISVNVPNSVTSIGERAFDGCSALTNIRIEDCERKLSMKYTAFLSCPLTTLYMGRNISTSNYISPFFDKSTLSTITISNSVTDIGACLFRDCSWLTEIKIPNSVTSIGGSAFYGCTGLTNVSIPNSVTSIGSSAFSGCTGLTNVSIPNSVTSFENSVFEGCSGLKSLRFEDGESTLTFSDKFPNTIDSLYLGRNIAVMSSYFNTGENKLSVLSIGKYVVSLDDKMFYYCNNITKVISYATEPPVAYPLTFTTDIYGKATLSVQGESMEKYRNADVWKKFSKIEEIDNNSNAKEQCAAPVITYADGKLQFACETEGAECKYTLTAKDIQTAFITASNNSVDLTACYDITAYAVAEGYKNSEKVTATLYWIDGSDVSTNINQTEMRGVMATCSDGIITVSGLSDGETVMFYDANGALLYTGTAQNGTISYAPSTSGVIIVKIGSTSIKVVS